MQSRVRASVRGDDLRSLLVQAVCTLALCATAVANNYGNCDVPVVVPTSGQTVVGGSLNLSPTAVHTCLDENNNVVTVQEAYTVTACTVIDPCGRATVLGAGRSEPLWSEWTVPAAGLYTVILTVTGSESGATGTNVFTLSAEAPGGCTACGKNAPQPTLQGPSWESVQLYLGLGTITDGESAGFLYVRENEPSVDLARIGTLHRDIPINGPDVTVYYKNDSNQSWQVKSPQVLADVVVTSAYSYEVVYYAAPNQLGTLVGTPPYQYYDQSGKAPYRKWQVVNPNNGSSYNTLDVTEYVDDGSGSLVVRTIYHYVATYSNGYWNWVLTTKDSAQNALRVETVDWSAVSSSIDKRQYAEKDATGQQLVHRVDREYTKYTVYSQTERQLTREVVDPGSGGANLETLRTYNLSFSGTLTGMQLTSTNNPDGSWMRTIRTVETNGDLTVQQINGWKDQAYDTQASWQGAGVRGVQLKYQADSSYRLIEMQEYTNGVNTRHSTYAYQQNGLIQTEHQFVNVSTSLATETGYVQDHTDRLSYVKYPDGRWDAYEYADGISYTVGTGVPPTHYELSYNTGVSGNYYYRAVAHGYGDTTQAFVSNKSTKEVSILDAGGLPVYEETRIYDGSGWSSNVATWTERRYDAQHRLLYVFHHDQTYESMTYPSCCTQVATDAGGVETTYVYDPLGRISQATRSAVSAYQDSETGSYAVQQAIVTNYDYSTARQITTTRQSGTLSETTTQKYDLAKRVTSVITGAGDGQLATLFKYEGPTENGGGQKATRYLAYPPSSTQGTPGVRDEIRQYYRDGRLASVSGAAAVASYYDYSCEVLDGAGLRHTITSAGHAAATPPAANDRYTITTYDMLGRTKQVDRPGWATSGTTLNTIYSYDASTGRQSSVQAPGQALTLYEYDNLSNVSRTALDVGGGGSINLASMDRVTDPNSYYAFVDGFWWLVQESSTYPKDNDGGVRVRTACQMTRFGVDSNVNSEMRSIDAKGNVTIVRTVVDRAHKLVKQYVDSPDAGTAHNAITGTFGGRVCYSGSKTGVVTRYTYDRLGRRSSVIDGRDNSTVTGYDTSGRVSAVTDAFGSTLYGYYGQTGNYPGRLYYTENALGNRTYYAYNGRGQVTQTWGDVPLPTLTEYNEYGERVSLTTFRGGTWTAWPNPLPSGDTTSWSFHEATGLLNSKTYADQTSVQYTYYPEKRMYSRTWARTGPMQVTSYVYDANTGELTETHYSQGSGMTDLYYQYNRMGRMSQVSDAAGTHVLAYDADTSTGTLQLTKETSSGGAFDGYVITQLYETSNDPNPYPGRFKGVQVGTAQVPNAYYESLYGYDSDGTSGTGRLNRVISGPGLPAGGATYSYLASTDLIATLKFKDGSNNVKGWSAWTYESERNLLANVQNNWGSEGNPTTISQYRYSDEMNFIYDALGRRVVNERSGQAFGGSEFNEQYQYDDRGELQHADYYDDVYPGTLNQSKSNAWTFDNASNRENATAGGLSVAYVSNELNQYERWDHPAGPIARERFSYDADGNLSASYVAGDMNCDGHADFNDINLLVEAIDCSNVPACWYDAGHTCPFENADINGDGSVDFNDTNPFVTMLTSGGNHAAARTFTWDAENRLIQVAPTPGTEQNGQTKSVFHYDYLGRRYEKLVYSRSGGQWDTTPVLWRRYLYQGWRMLLELDMLAQSGPGILRKYTWGLDLAGRQGGAVNSLEGSGGIGGLLAVWQAYRQPGGNPVSYVYFYDGNGNVGQVVDLFTATPPESVQASYDYDAYGGARIADGTYAADNPMRFSTKYFDDETGFGYWGMRHYDPAMGRWLNRDPLQETAGFNMYTYVANEPISGVDSIGLMETRQRTLCPTTGTPSDPPAPSPSIIPGLRGQGPDGPPYSDCRPCSETTCKALCKRGWRAGTYCEDPSPNPGAPSGPCCCVCPNPISKDAGGDPGAINIITACAAAHEGKHASGCIQTGHSDQGLGDECIAVTESYNCMGDNAQNCTTKACIDAIEQMTCNESPPPTCNSSYRDTAERARNSACQKVRWLKAHRTDLR